jgi:multiple sugar transport system ATP-binding protein
MGPFGGSCLPTFVRFAPIAALPARSRFRPQRTRRTVRHPKAFLFGEPLWNLDAKLRVQMRVEIKKIHARLGTTAIYVTHDQVEAMTLGDRVVVMRDGVVQQVGEPLELYNAPANRFVTGFIGSPAMNFATVTIAADADGLLWANNEAIHIKLPAAVARRLLKHVGENVTLGIRPEDLRVASSSDPADGAFDAMVEVVEKLGPEILLDVKVGPSMMAAAVEPTVRAKVRDQLRLALNPDRLYFFDGASQAAI